MPRSITLICTALLLTSCAVGPDYSEPSLDLPDWWHSMLAAADIQPAMPATPPNEDKRWWIAFNDPMLNKLIERALANNQDLQLAQARIMEARGAKQTATSGLFPQINADGQANREKEGFPAALSPSLNKPIDIYQADFDASWEIDLFGGTRRQVEAANADIAARKADVANIRITLIGDVIRNYVEWRQLQQQVLLTKSTVEAQRKLFTMTDQKYKVGTSSRFDASQARSLYQSTAAHLPVLEAQQNASGYRLSLLLGEAAGPLNDELRDPKPLPEPIALPVLNAPADIIRRRPDVQSAERELAAATALQGVAISELFPKLTLSGLYGIQNTSISPSSHLWSFGSGLTMPILNFGRIKGEIKQADAREQQAYHAYRKTVLAAVSEIETALSNIDHESQHVAALKKSAASAQETVAMARNRFHHGISPFTETLLAEQQLYSAQSDLMAARATLVSNIVTLYKALGLIP